MSHHHSVTRRDFVAATTLGAVGLLRGPGPLGSMFPPRADTALMYVGTYTDAGRRDGIYLVRMDSASGALERVVAVDAGSNPSFLTIHPDGRVLYAVNETNVGAVRAFGIDVTSGALTAMNEFPSEGAAPCYVSTDRKGRAVFVANYTGGTVAMMPLDETNGLSAAAQVKQHMGTGPVASRQEKAHAHCIIPHPNNKLVLAADLGVDRVLVYRFDDETGLLTHLEQSDGVLPPGTGPRHLVFHPRLPLVYLAGELNSTVTALRCDADTGALTVAQSLTTLPAGYTGQNSPADIHVSPDGRALYVSNRGHNSVAVYSINDRGTLALAQTMSTGGDWPRNFTLDPTGRWLLAANQRSNSIVVFARDPQSGRLTTTSQRLDIPSPVCLRFQSAASWT